jgi:hypothetical protein
LRRGWHSFCNIGVEYKPHTKENGMLALQHNHSAASTQSFSGGKTHTTLYDVIEAVAAVIGPDEEKLVGTVVMQLLGDYRARLEVGLWNGSEKTKEGNCQLHLCRREEA